MQAHMDKEGKSEDGLEARIRFLQHQVRARGVDGGDNMHAYHTLTEQAREDQIAERNINKTTTMIAILFTNK